MVEPVEAAAIAAAECTVFDPKSKFKIEAHKKKHPKPKPWCWLCNWDGSYHLAEDNRFPTGLLSKVETALQANGWEIEIVDGRREPVAERHPLPEDFQFRPHQAEVFPLIEAAPRGMWEMPPSAGKTIILLARWYQLRVPGLIMVPSRAIAKQFIDTAKRVFGIDAGLVGEGKWKPAELTIAITAMLWARREKPEYEELIKSIDFLGIDETHHLGALTWYKIAMDCPAYYRYGQSATLKRTDAFTICLQAATGPLLCSISAAELVERGQIAKPIFIIHKARPPAKSWKEYIEEHTSPDKELSSAQLYRLSYEYWITNNSRRNAQILEIARREYDEGRTVLILVQRLPQGWYLQTALRAIGYPCEFLLGQTKSKHMYAILDKARAGERMIVIGSPMLDEGVDVPAFESVIIACAGKSHIKTIQRIGRGMRPKEGENTVRIHDFVDDDPLGYLRRHSHSRIAMYKKQGGHIEYA